MSEILYGNEIAKKIKQEVSDKVSKMPTKVSLAIIYVGDDPGSASYRMGLTKTAASTGIEIIEYGFETISEDDLIDEIKRINKSDVSGIMLQMPLPKGFDTQRVVDAIDPNKDVDGLTSSNIANLYTGKKGFVPCTAQAVIEILDQYNIDIEGKNAVVIGRSAAVGRPVAQLLLKRNATVTTCHSRTKNIADIVRRAEILVVAIGRGKFVKEDWITDGTTIVDVGINYDENGKLVGDADFENIIKKEVKITPVPKGVGSMTSAILLRNVLEAYGGKD